MVHNLHTQEKESDYQSKITLEPIKLSISLKKKLRTAKQVHEQQDIHQLKHPKYSKQFVLQTG